jgi:hypothetical protein
VQDGRVVRPGPDHLSRAAVEGEVNGDDGEGREARVGQLDAEEGAQLLEEELLMPKVMQGNARASPARASMR